MQTFKAGLRESLRISPPVRWILAATTAVSWLCAFSSCATAPVKATPGWEVKEPEFRVYAVDCVRNTDGVGNLRLGYTLSWYERHTDAMTHQKRVAQVSTCEGWERVIEDLPRVGKGEVTFAGRR